MRFFHLVSHFIVGSAGSGIALFGAILVSTVLVEDATAIIVGILAADGIVPIPLALAALYSGIVSSDLGLYGLGWLASTHERLARYADHELAAPFRAWLETRYVLTIFFVRFIPGARLPTYTSSGFFRSSFSKFVLVALIAASVWTTALFSASFWFGNLTAHWLGPVRWGVALVALVGLFMLGRFNVRLYRSKKQELRPGNGPR